MFHVLPNRIPWFVAGPLISLLVVGLYAVMNKPLGASGAYVNVATVFGRGWAIAVTCPAPALAMLASGSVLALVVIGGIFAGILLRDAVVARQVVRDVGGIDMGPVVVRKY